MILGEICIRKKCQVYDQHYSTMTNESITFYDDKFNLHCRLLKSPKCSNFDKVVYHRDNLTFLCTSDLLMVFKDYVHVASANLPSKLLSVFKIQKYYGIVSATAFTLTSIEPQFKFEYATKWERLQIRGIIQKAIFHHNLLFIATTRKLLILDTFNSVQADDWNEYQSIDIECNDFDVRGNLLVISHKFVSIYKHLNNYELMETIKSPESKLIRLSNDLKYLVVLYKTDTTWFNLYLLSNFKIFSSDNWSSFLNAPTITGIDFSINEMHLVFHSNLHSYFIPIAKLSYEITPSYLNAVFPCILTQHQLHMAVSVAQPFSIPGGSHFIPLAYPNGFQLNNFKTISILNTKDLLFLTQITKIHVFSKSQVVWQEIDFKASSHTSIDSIVFANNCLVCLITNEQQFLVVLDFNKEINLDNIPKIPINFNAYRLDYIKPYLYLFGTDNSVTAYSFDGIKHVECLFEFDLPFSQINGFVMNHTGPHALSSITSHANMITLSTFTIKEPNFQLTKCFEKQLHYPLLGCAYFPIFTDLFSHCYCLLGPGHVKIYCMIDTTPFDFTVDYPVDLLPVAVDIQNGLLLLIELESSRVFHQDAPLIKLNSITQPFLHRFAFEICLINKSLLSPFISHFSYHKEFEHYLELIFFYFWQQQQFISELLMVLKSTTQFYDVLAKVARKMESIYWKDLFILVGESPEVILQKCLKLEKYRTASCYLVLCEDNVEFMEQDCIELLKGALDIKDLQLSKEILDYIHKIGDSNKVIDMVTDRYKHEFMHYFTKFYNVNDLFDRHCSMLYQRKQYGDLYDTIQLAGTMASQFIEQHPLYFDLELNKSNLVLLHHSYHWPLNYTKRRGSLEAIASGQDSQSKSASVPTSRKTSLIKTDLQDKRVLRLTHIIELLKDTPHVSLLLMLYTMIHHVEEIKTILENKDLRTKWIVLMDEMDTEKHLELKELVIDIQ